MSGIMKTLPKTGMVVVAGGFTIWQFGLIAVAVGVVAVAAATIRVGFRRRKPVGRA